MSINSLHEYQSNSLRMIFTLHHFGQNILSDVLSHAIHWNRQKTQTIKDCCVKRELSEWIFFVKHCEAAKVVNCWIRFKQVPPRLLYYFWQWEEFTNKIFDALLHCPLKMWSILHPGTGVKWSQWIWVIRWDWSVPEISFFLFFVSFFFLKWKKTRRH